MDADTITATADFFLRELPSVKTSNSKPTVSKPPVKEELKTLYLSEKAQEQVIDTLKYIHGPEFILADASKYENSDNKFFKKYWQERGNLVIKGATNYSQIKDTPEEEAEKLKVFALLRLESYGFHKNHCIEALEYTNYNIEDAIYVLYSKYFNAKPAKSVDHDLSEKELLEQREDEKSSLESIYETAFTEKLKNTVWMVSLKLDFLIARFHNKEKPVKKTVVAPKGKPMCRGFLQGKCKFGGKCRFSHIENKEEKNTNAHIEEFSFDLEVRFPENTKYPYEPPLIFLKTNAVIPHLVLLHICKKLYEEAEILAQDGIPSVYSVVELLKNEAEIGEHLKSEPRFLDKNQSLFPQESELNRSLRPSHYKKGVTNRDNKKFLSAEDVFREDQRIVEGFLRKTSEEKYIKMLRGRRNLPAWALMKEILAKINSNQVIVISGETGCGKSTQIPQFILDNWLANFEHAQRHLEIVCTQPRRISALGVAERVADERVERVGGTVGYQIRLESKVSGSTRLTFCTTGILLRRLEGEPLLKGVTHVIVDEVHERSVESDFLLLILRDILPKRPDLKVILMSATLNAQLFRDYFGATVPVLDIPGRTFPVEQYFLEDILESLDCVLEPNSPYMQHRKDAENLDEMLEMCRVSAAQAQPKENVKDENLSLAQIVGRYREYSAKTWKQLYLIDPEKINIDLIEAILVWIEENFGGEKEGKKGSILIFLPGIAEITTLYDHLKDHPQFTPRKGNYVLVPLHSSLTSEEQAAVFKTPRSGVRKIVLSTNIAETSVTIDDCVFVIDSGKMKEKHFDSNRNMESLETVWVTRANALQRRGRAGRVMAGVCIHLYTRHRFEHQFLGQPVPEIHRIPLEQLLLNVKVLPIFAERDVFNVLGSVLEPPSKENIHSAIDRLHSVGAFDKDNNLTPLGHHLAALPVDVRIGKLMLYGAMFCCVDSALTIASCLSYKSPFVSPFGKKDIADARKKKFSVGYSDQLTILMAYRKWQEANFKSRMAGNNFANENYLSVKTLQMLADIKHQLLELLVSIDFVPVNLGQKRRRTGEDNVFSVTGSEFNRNGDNWRLLSSILCAALYPNVVKVMSAGKSFQMSASGAIAKETAAKDLKFRTKDDWVFLHPSSVIYDVKNFPSPYLVYQEKVKTSRIYIRDCCMVPVIPLVLFSGFDVDIRVNNGITYVVLEDGWIIFKVEEHRVAEMIKTIRLELVDLLEEKIADPLLNLLHHDKGEKIISTILNLVTNEM